MNLFYYSCLFAGVSFNVLGSFFIKKWADSNNNILFLYASVCYAIDLIIWAILFKTGAKLSTLSAVWDAMGIVLATLVAFFVLGEHPTAIQIMGIVFIIIGIVLCH